MARKAAGAVEKLQSLMKIGEVSRLSGIGIEALRFYERTGLLGRPTRTSSGYRLYNKQVLTRIDFIKRAQMLGFSLEEIRKIITDSESGKSPCAEVKEMVRDRLEKLDEHLKQLKRYRKELVETLVKWESGETEQGLLCGLIEGSEIVSPVHNIQTSRQKIRKSS
jgi:MerR family transcriptional regulator, copper efflux regulator